MAGSVTRSTARQELAKRAAEFVMGTATGGSTTTLIDTNNLQYVDSFWNEQYILFTSGANNGLTRKVSAFTSASSQATLYSAVTAVASGDTYELYRRFSPVDHNSALNAAINKSWPAFYQHRSTAVVTAAQDTLEYGFPTGPGMGDKGLIAIEYQRWTLATQSTFPYQVLSADDYEVRVDTLPRPDAPVVIDNGAGGNVLTLPLQYSVTYVLGGAESPPSAATTYTQPSSGHSNLVTFAAGPTGTTARRIYVSNGITSIRRLLTTISNNTTLLYVHDGSITPSGAEPDDAVTRYVLQLRFNPDTNRLIRFVFGSPIPKFAADTDYINLGDPELEWLYAQAKAELWRIEANRSEAIARKDALQMMASSQQEADALKKDLAHYWPPKPIRRTRFYLGGVV